MIADLHPFVATVIAPMEIPFLLETIDTPGSHVMDSDDLTYYKKLTRLAPDGSKLKIECEVRADYHNGACDVGLTKEEITLAGRITVPVDSVIYLTDKEQEDVDASWQLADWRKDCWEQDKDNQAENRDYDRDR